MSRSSTDVIYKLVYAHRDLISVLTAPRIPSSICPSSQLSASYRILNVLKYHRDTSRASWFGLLHLRRHATLISFHLVLFELFSLGILPPWAKIPSDRTSFLKALLDKPLAVGFSCLFRRAGTILVIIRHPLWPGTDSVFSLVVNSSDNRVRTNERTSPSVKCKIQYTAIIIRDVLSDLILTRDLRIA